MHSPHTHSSLAPALFLGGLLAGSLGGALSGCESSRAGAAVPADTTPEVVEVSTATARVEQIPNTLALDGTLQPRRHARLSPLVSGHVAQVRVERGDVVAEGDPLVVLRQVDLRLAARAASARAEAQLEQLGVERTTEFDPDAVPEVVAARADWENLEDQLRRVTPLHAEGVVDDRSFEQARSAAEAARARYDQARTRARGSLASYVALSSEARLRRNEASNTTVRAPFAGAIMERLVEVGEFVGTQSPVVELVDASELRLELAVPERYAALVHEGQSVQVTVDGTEQQVTGEVRFIAAALDTANRTLTIEVVIDNHDGAIRAGHFARAELQLDGTRRVVRVPTNALSERAGVYRLFVVEDGIATTTAVRVIDRTDDVTTLDAELPDGTVVVTLPPRNLADGVPVRVVPES
ncbi:MAG: efflux RND transporter periplasmic adaptor subunit [Polyangiales bacterium]|nr:efflux RND transporter periplasmic adaptor subunit [Myxococcales bacterium]MCB9657458.1 efflux RND transporter periplasmic adaptor subunit [Sandaracinaceae bacterium]